MCESGRRVREGERGLGTGCEGGGGVAVVILCLFFSFFRSWSVLYVSVGVRIGSRFN